MTGRWRLPSDRSYWFLVASTFLMSCGYGMWGPLWSAWTRDLGATARQVGIVVSTVGLAFMTTAFAGGVLADAVDHRSLLIVGWTVSSACAAAFLVARTWRAVALGMALWGAAGIAQPAVLAYASNRADPNARGMAFALITAAGPLARVVTGGLGGALAQERGMAAVFWVAAALFALSTALLFWLEPEPSRRGGGEPLSRLRRQAGRQGLNAAPPWAVVVLSLMFALPHVWVFLCNGLVGVAYREVARLDYRHVGMLGSVLAAGGVVLSPLLGRLGDRAGHELSAVIGVVLASFGFLGIVAWRSFLPLCIAAFLLASVEAVSVPMSAAVRKVAGDAHSGKGFGLLQVARSLPMLVSPYLGGLMFDRDPILPFTVAGGGLLASALVMAVVLVGPGGLPWRRASG